MEKTIFFQPNILHQSFLSPEESLHCCKVLRKKEGDTILIADGKGYFHDAEIINANHKKTEVKITSSEFIEKSWNFNLHIAFAPTKNMDRIEWFAEKATEIGIDRFTPLLCQNSERKVFKTERIQKILISAMKQSQKSFIPQIDELTPFDKFLETVPQDISSLSAFIAHCRDDEKNLLESSYSKGNDAIVLIGPEGDFSKQEINKALSANFLPISLGHSRLRTETAALFSCNYLQILNL